MIYWLDVDLLDSRREADLFLFNSLASLASFCLWAKILAYSAAASLFFSPLLLLRASLCLFLCNMTGVTNLWTKILAYSAAASLFFSPLLLFRASLCLFLCNMTGVTNLWTLGALNF